MQRSVVGAPGMSPEAAAFYQDVFKKVYESAEWQEYMKTKSLRGDFLTGEGLMEYWKKGRALHEKMLSDIGDI
jgi:tripartite-type tricarboxylate transporter receptor subunit TctC